jgi:hypothetical protein
MPISLNPNAQFVRMVSLLKTPYVKNVVTVASNARTEKISALTVQWTEKDRQTVNVKK